MAALFSPEPVDGPIGADTVEVPVPPPAEVEVRVELELTLLAPYGNTFAIDMLKHAFTHRDALRVVRARDNTSGSQCTGCRSCGYITKEGPN